MPEWPRAPTSEQARAFAVAWCLLPVARRRLEESLDLEALLLAAELGTDGSPRLLLVEWSELDLPRLLPPDTSRSERAHAMLAEIYGGDPLSDVEHASEAIRPFCASQGVRGIVGVATRGERDIQVECVRAPVEPELERDPGLDDKAPAASDVDVTTLHRALRELNELETLYESVQHHRSLQSHDKHPEWAFNAVHELSKAAWNTCSVELLFDGSSHPPRSGRRVMRGSSRELRALCMDERFRPLAKAFFEREPEVKALLYCIAQYWNDEADDAVHEAIVPCVLRDPPSWPHCLEHNPYVTTIDEAEGRAYFLSFAVNDTVRSLSSEIPALDDNDGMVRAFASCVHESTSQDDDLAEAYRPYAIARRMGDGVDIEVVGTVLRPDWEDAFTLARRESLFEKLTRPVPPPPLVAPARARSWWRRLLGLD